MQQLPRSSREHVMDPSRLSLADVYVEGLISQLDADEIDQLDRELDELETLLEHIEGFEELVAVSLISARERRELVERVFQGRCSLTLLALLRILARHNRLVLLRTICRRFHKFHERTHGRVDVFVTSPVEMSPPEQEALARKLGQSLQLDPVLTVKVDPALLGGLIVRVGDRLFDASLATQLRRLRRRIASRVSDQQP
ncbi:MAG: ATP synthase subunit delta, sodium ion specific [Planctomycetes bacterium ADurb.Bin126]|nr:MAG: ATP synthase subunit delta, sodium ion specific [Planctomycetes bacterium ADurb.Bin126]HOD83221.1 ATP synthase F1 subunit delta [Phycisphaerae bacterium]HQL71893.1 ATP synthase F1 subunit delta [Phycisphaerae bacterium]